MSSSIDDNYDELYEQIVAQAVPWQHVADRAVCDDCGDWYAAPAYYTFDTPDCTVENGAHDCSGNVCPRCCGPDMEPDNLFDVRYHAMLKAREKRSGGEMTTP